jgi:glutamyl-Q tRNA(Asp) synthetase
MVRGANEFDACGAAVSPVLRFAPSPTGFMHLGHARSAALNWRIAHALGGRMLLRIEDIDPTRSRPEYVAAIVEDLAWLGLSWPAPPRRQSAHFNDYRQAANRLLAEGLLYPCFATRTHIDAAADPSHRDPDGAVLYPGIWRERDAADVAAQVARGQPYALRLDMAKALRRIVPAALTFRAWDGHPGGDIKIVTASPERWGDPVIVRKEAPTSYHLSVVIDDALQGVTHVVRGQDLYAATDLHRLLQVLLGLPEPVYHHHSLITDASGRKLSKSDGDTTLRAMRAAGLTPDEVLRRALLDT